MSKTITIPVSAGNRLKVTLNGKEYDLPTGVEISVPDEVAALFDNNAANAPKTGREPMAWNDGAGPGGGGGSGLVVAHATVIMNQIVPGENIEITLDKTFEELKAAGANSVIELGILADATATVPASFYYLHPLYALSADGTDTILYGFSMSEGAAISVGVMTNEAVLMLEESDTVETVLVEATLGEGADNVYPVTAIDKDYYEIINAGICFARYNVDGITYTSPRVVYGYQEGANKVLFAGSGSEMMLSFDNSTFDPENSSVTL